MLTLKIYDINNSVVCCESGEQIEFTFNGEFREGHTICVDMKDTEFIAVQFDETMKESIVYVPNHTFTFTVPYDNLMVGYAPEAFKGDSHVLRARIPSDEELYERHLISLNSHDIRENDKAFPHVHANLVTRNEPWFFERNAIDGVCDNTSHGEYPYHSWAAGAREDMEFYLYFGRPVEIDEIVFVLRADFPHDTYWKSLEIEFSDNTRIPAQFVKTVDGQSIKFDKKTTEYIHLTNFKQVSEQLSWAALSQIEVYGAYIKEDLSKMEVRNASNAKDVKHYTTDRLREEFHISKLFTKDNTRMVYSHIDRIITAGIMPVFQTLKLEAGKELAADYFLQRREMGCINIGGKGIITIDGTEYVMEPRDGIYIGMGNKDIEFKSIDPNDPAKFYVSSCPAHKEYPIVKIDISKAKKVPCGTVEDCNKRVINQYIHPEVMQSCQLSMGLTQLEPGSNWNTMPSHTHDRRMEVYLYLDMGENDAVFHMMGEPNETRHIIMHNEEAVISPSWSIHSGVGTKAYSFIWAMCGENQEFTDMDHIETKDLR